MPGRAPWSPTPFDFDCALARELGMTLEGVLAMHPAERYKVWPSFLRRHPATMGETRILWMLARIGALIYNRTRGKGEQPQTAGDLLAGLLPAAESQAPAVAKRSMFEVMMTATIDHLREEHAAKQAALAADNGDSVSSLVEGEAVPDGATLSPGAVAPEAAQEAAHG